MSLAFRQEFGVGATWESLGMTPDQVSDFTGLACKDVSLAQQQFKDEADVNVIVERYMTKGVLPQIQLPPQMQEFGEVFDFQSAMNVINAGQRAFAAMDANVRERFNHDAGKFMAFCEERDVDGKLTNLDEMRKMRLAVPAPEPVPEVIQKVEVINREQSQSPGSK